MSEISSVEWTWVSSKEDVEWTLSQQNFRYVFVFRWPHMLSKSVLDSSECVGFHTSNLPEGRGGSPLQNQIMDGIVSTRVNALRLTDVMDGGPVYASMPITLQGPIQDVWSTISLEAAYMIEKIVKERPDPVPQVDTGHERPYSRRRNNDLETVSRFSIEKVHKFIQMLDGDGYPGAHFDLGDYDVRLTRSSLRNGEILCDARIRRKVSNLDPEVT